MQKAVRVPRILLLTGLVFGLPALYLWGLGGSAFHYRAGLYLATAVLPALLEGLAVENYQPHFAPNLHRDLVLCGLAVTAVLLAAHRLAGLAVLLVGVTLLRRLIAGTNRPGHTSLSVGLLHIACLAGITSREEALLPCLAVLAVSAMGALAGTRVSRKRHIHHLVNPLKISPLLLK